MSSVPVGSSSKVGVFAKFQFLVIFTRAGTWAWEGHFFKEEVIEELILNSILISVILAGTPKIDLIPAG